MSPPDWVTLRIFLAALDLGSVTKAAERCGIAVSAAAKRIQDLEADHGVRLLERTARGVRPTSAGDILAGHARTLLALAERLGHDLRAARMGGAGSVRIDATTSIVAGHDLAERLAAFGRDHPGIRVELGEETSLTGLRNVVEGRSDLALLTTPQAIPDGIAVRTWRHDRLLVVLPASHVAAGRSSIRFGEVLDWPLIGVIPNGALSLMLDEAAQKAGRRPDYGYRVATADAAMRLVAAGHGVTVMPDGVMSLFAENIGLVGIPLDEPWAARELRLVSRPPEILPIPARLLVEHLAPSDA